ncbi:MAG: GNAT family N-acetyltransferase [Phyllobacterium sp.]|uniref:GNAT family N-acetyltransferase n=1 Tax=Phyllobacterium sp. TaxID=1871046 RepID=UPI0030F1C1B7
MIAVEPLEKHPGLVSVCARWNYDEWGKSAGRTLERTIDDLRGFLEPSSRQKGLVGFVSGVPSGLALLIDNDLETHPHLQPWLASLYVVPEQRGKSLGGALIAATEETARSLGHRELFLYTEKGDYYLRFGWQPYEALTGEDAGYTILSRRL